MPAFNWAGTSANKTREMDSRAALCQRTCGLCYGNFEMCSVYELHRSKDYYSFVIVIITSCALHQLLNKRHDPYVMFLRFHGTERLFRSQHEPELKNVLDYCIIVSLYRPFLFVKEGVFLFTCEFIEDNGWKVIDGVFCKKNLITNCWNGSLV